MKGENGRIFNDKHMAAKKILKPAKVKNWLSLRSFWGATPSTQQGFSTFFLSPIKMMMMIMFKRMREYKQFTQKQCRKINDKKLSASKDVLKALPRIYSNHQKQFLFELLLICCPR